MIIIPTIFAHNKKEFSVSLKKILPISKQIQIDFMDGKFVKAKSVSLASIPHLKKYKQLFEAHLMTYSPQKYISAIKQKGFNKVLFHYEAIKNIQRIQELISKIKKNKMEAWIVFNPSSNITIIYNIINSLKDLNGIMLMGHTPGIEGLKLQENIINKIREIRKQNKNIKIQVDGGINIKTAKILKNLGVNAINVGSYISKSKNPKKALRELKKSIS